MDEATGPCGECGKIVLKRTLERTSGLCMPCMKRLELAACPAFVPLTPEDVSRIERQRIEKLSPELRSILESEVALGNEVVETSDSWPGESSVFVMLRRPFMRGYSGLPSFVVFRDIDDRHYWKAEFVDVRFEHILACRF